MKTGGGIHNFFPISILTDYGMARQCMSLNFVDYIEYLVFYIQKIIDLLLVILRSIKIYFS